MIEDEVLILLEGILSVSNQYFHPLEAGAAALHLQETLSFTFLEHPVQELPSVVLSSNIVR